MKADYEQCERIDVWQKSQKDKNQIGSKGLQLFICFRVETYAVDLKKTQQNRHSCLNGICNNNKQSKILRNNCRQSMVELVINDTIC